MKISKHWAFYLLLWAGSLLIFSYFVLLPMRNQLKSLEEEKARLRQEVVVLQRKIAELRELEERLRELEDFAQTLSRRLPEEKDIPDLLVTIEDAAFLSGLELVSLKPESMQPREGYTEIPFSGSVRTSFQSFLFFLNYLRRSPRLIQVQTFSFQGKEEPFRVDFSLSTYLLGGAKRP